MPDGPVLKKKRSGSQKKKDQRKDLICFKCRKPGHLVSKCPNVDTNVEVTDSRQIKETGVQETGICYHCGSTEHKASQCKSNKGSFKFATCFICRDTGHISKNCPKNPRGVYPKGGACTFCNKVDHLRKDCPMKKGNSNEEAVLKVKPSVMKHALANPDEDDFEEELQPRPRKKPKVLKVL